MVDVELSDNDARTFLRAAAQNVDSGFALILDDKVLAIPTIEPDLVTNFDGKIEIVGQKSQQESESVASELRALPV
jgi:preprotein translocase subunit SecD